MRGYGTEILLVAIALTLFIFAPSLLRYFLIIVLFAVFITIAPEVISPLRARKEEEIFRKAVEKIGELLREHLPDGYIVTDISPMLHTIIVDIKQSDDERSWYRVVFYRWYRIWGFASTPMTIPKRLQLALIDVVRGLDKL